jgi:3-hydroxyisobutyrate dehydrogenase
MGAGVRVGLIGTGRMGLPICTNLVQAGHQVTAGDNRPDRAGAVRVCGALWGGSVAQVAARVEVLVTVLPGTQEVHDVMLDAGALAALPAGATWIDMTSASPAAARLLRTAAQARGVDVLEAPMGGGVPAARAGTLQLFVGGEAAVLDRHLALLRVVADPRRITLMGGHGAGYTAKLLVNLLWFGQAVATAEALLLACRSGIDLDVLQQALGDSAAASSFIQRDLGALLSGDYLPSFGLDRCCEELAAINALARECRVPFELSAVVEAVYLRAMDRYGPADGELLAMALLEQDAGTLLRHGLS